MYPLQLVLGKALALSANGIRYSCRPTPVEASSPDEGIAPELRATASLLLSRAHHLSLSLLSHHQALPSRATSTSSRSSPPNQHHQERHCLVASPS